MQNWKSNLETMSNKYQDVSNNDQKINWNYIVEYCYYCAITFTSWMAIALLITLQELKLQMDNNKPDSNTVTFYIYSERT